MPALASQTLDLVGREVNATITEARTALESYVEQPDNSTLLERCVADLHQVQGVLRLLEIYGAALLAEEMEHVAQYLLETHRERKSQAESLDALMRAMVQLPSYLERVLAGGRDLALVLLPLLNDLRAVRGNSLLSEGTLLLLNLKSDKQPQPQTGPAGESPMTVEQWARRLRARYQLGLIGWIRGERIEHNLEILAAVARKLEQIATRQPLFQLWWVIGAVIEALQEKGLQGGQSIKRLLGLGDREMRRLYEQGEAHYAQTPPVELLNNLLYYVGRAESSGMRVGAVRASFRLSELLPVDESIEQERENLSAPSVKLMQTVAAAIREDLAKVKDVLDIFVRRGAAQPAELAPQVELLRKIGDTLGVLGLGELRASVQLETERLGRIVGGQLRADEQTLVEIAATLIGIEDKLDDGLVSMILPPRDTEIAEVPGDSEFQQVQSAVLRECIVNLARIKEAVAQSVGGTLDAAGLDSWQDLMRGIQAGLLLLGKTRAVEVIEGITTQLKRVMQPGSHALALGFVDRLADAIVSVEYYMETLQAGRADPWYMLDNAQACVSALEQQETPPPPTVPPVEPGAYAKTMAIPGLMPPAEEAPDLQALDSTAPTLKASPAAKAQPPVEHTDPELTKLFTEEAREELTKIQRDFPIWDQNPLERDALISVRRSFHTLKGSGRMVGARSLGEFAWSIENLLNRVLDNTISRSPQILSILRQAVATLPEFVAELENGTPVATDAAAISSSAHALAAGRSARPDGEEARVALRPAPPVPPPAPAPAPVAAPAPAAPEPVMAASAAPAPVAPEPPPLPEPAPLMAVAEPAPIELEVSAPAIVLASPPEPEVTPPPAPLVEQPVTDKPAEYDTLISAAELFSPEEIFATRTQATEEPFALEDVFAAEAPPPAEIEPPAAAGAAPEVIPPPAPAAPVQPTAEIIAVAPEPDLAAVASAAEPALATPVESIETVPAALVPETIEELSFVAAAAEEDGELQQDDTLRDIYARETASHVATVRAFLARESQLSEPHALSEEVYRACHTLSGSSKMAQARHGIRLAEPLDHWLRRAYASGMGLSTADLALLGDCMVAMESVATHLDEPTGYFVNHWALLERIERADRGLDQRIAAAQHAQAVPHPVPHAPPPPAAAPLAEPSQAADTAASVVEEVVDFDPEVAAIFTDEATELIEASEQALADWRSHPDNADSRLGLKRPLHTLKGGARMAGITPMGDLSHELESLVMLVDTGRLTAGPALFDAIQASLDELARMREQVATGQRVATARAIIARLQSLSRAGAAPAQAAAAAALTPAPAAAPAMLAEPAAAAPVEIPQPVREAEVPLAAATAVPAIPETLAPLGLPDTHTADQDTALRKMNAELLLAAQAAEQVPTAPVGASAAEEAAAQEPAAASAPHPAEREPDDSLAPPQPVPPGRDPVTGGERTEMARVDAELLDQLLNISGEASIARARLEQQLGSLDFNLGELARTVTRLKEQLRSLEIETEAQILHKHEDEGPHRSEFDPLELDRYSSIQQYSRALAETANDVQSIQQLLENLAKDTQTLLQQQARTITELQNGLMRTRMVPFQRHVQRLARIVRQAAADTGKRAELIVEGASGELDRQVLERMLPPFEHMLRNAVVHGIESPEERIRRGKPDTGRILLDLQREGAEVLVRLTDDGGGMNIKAIRDKALSLGLIGQEQTLSDEEAMQLILEPGFSTAGSITQQAGRGVGMDVVATEIKRLGGALHMETKAGEGTVFSIRLPLTLAISHALVVRTDEEYYALPLPTIEGVLRLSKTEVTAHLGREATPFDYGGQKYRFQHLGMFVGLPPAELPGQDVTIPVVLVRAGEHSTGLVADELIGSREIVVKSVGPQISSIRGISGATILGDGRIVIILDIGALVRAEWRSRAQPVAPPRDRTDRRTFAMVVDDSITVRRVTQRLLERNGMRVLTARDGMDAIALLQDNVPDVILLDIEMPRMDGYEVAAHVRNDPRLKEVPIIMVTSRVGEKHRARAIELGVDDYLGKPYQEAQLLDAIAPLVERRRARAQAYGS
jgi:chemosensory pili system protein ChpA (sensor histidine kinase/response regulator)